MNKRRIAAVAATALALCLTGSVTSSAATSTVQPTGTNTAVSPKDAASCVYTPVVPKDKFRGIPVFDATKAAQPFIVKLHTTQGTITFKALTDKAPCTTWSFRFLATRGYYNQTHCHRLTTQRLWVLQCGDPTGTGAGGPGYQFPDENLAGATYPAGTVAMANAGPNTNGSQFFFCWKDTKLSPAYTPFGVVTSGMDVLQRIGQAGEDDQNAPGDGYPNLYVEFHSVNVIPVRH